MSAGPAEGASSNGPVTPPTSDDAPKAAEPAKPAESAGPAKAAKPAKPSSILDTLRVGTVMTDGRGRVLLWNPMTEEILGWRAEEVVGRDVEELIEDPDGGRARHRALRRHRRWRGSLRVRHRDGHPVPIEGRISQLTDADGHTLVLSNIVETSRIRAVEHDLAALDALFASSPVGIGLLDTEGRYVRVNDALARLNGLPAEEHRGRHTAEVLPQRLAAEFAAAQAFVMDSGRPVLDMIVPVGGSYGSRSASLSRLVDTDGEPLGYACVVMDVTERHEALRKVEAARQRLALLDDMGVALGQQLDVDAVAQALATALVPRFADYCGVLLARTVERGGELPETELAPGTTLFTVGADGLDVNPQLAARMLYHGKQVSYIEDSVFARALHTGTPYLISSPEELDNITYPGDPTIGAALDLDIHTVLVAPLRARGVVLGLLVVGRSGSAEPYGQEDLGFVMELADRAGISLDNARLYARERAGALMLQRSLLPQRVPGPPGVHAAYRYVPGSSGQEVGGDWFDVVPLAGGRVALVVGDVMGHGLHAAVTMGRLRTAVRTLAGLDLQPDELLRRVNDLADDFAQGPDDPLIATCVYAVYDPSTSRCSLAAAGHPPPLLMTETPSGGWRAEPLELPAGVPLGVGGAPFETVEYEVPEGSVLALYTDGLIESRDEDITVGIERLRSLLTYESGALDTSLDASEGEHAEGDPSAAPGGPSTPAEAAADGTAIGLDGICDRVIHELERRTGSQPADDVALLMAQLGGLPEGSSASWTFPAERYAARRARDVVRATLREWGLAALQDEALLLVSELVTNSLRYAHGPIGLRMVRGSSLLVEVSDPLPDPPRERTAMPDDEGGRGIQLVARAARRWGTRHGAMGKTVWFELALP